MSVVVPSLVRVVYKLMWPLSTSTELMTECGITTRNCSKIFRRRPLVGRQTAIVLIGWDRSPRPMEGDCWFVLALKLSWQTVWPNLTPLLCRCMIHWYFTTASRARTVLQDNILVGRETLLGLDYHGNYTKLWVSLPVGFVKLYQSCSRYCQLFLLLLLQHSRYITEI